METGCAHSNTANDFAFSCFLPVHTEIQLQDAYIVLDGFSFHSF